MIIDYVLEVYLVILVIRGDLPVQIFISIRSAGADELCWLDRVWTVTRQSSRRQPCVRAESSGLCCAIVCGTEMYFCIFIVDIDMHIVYDMYMNLYIVHCLYMNL